jgi:tetratricopeptide (TPR) repeat protein
MRKLYLFINLLFVGYCTALAQVETTEYRVVSVVSEQQFYLNSSTRINGKTRTYITVDLPPNTVKWYYAVATELNQGSTAGLQLASKMTKLVDRSGISETLLYNAFASTGSSVIDVYQLDGRNIVPFIDKADYWGGTFSYNLSNSRENFGGGVVAASPMPGGKCYLGLRNTSSMDGKYVRIEVTALVKELVVDDSQWSVESKQELLQNITEAFQADSLPAEVSDKIARCLSSKVTRKYSPASFAELSEEEGETVFEKLLEQCMADLGLSYSDKALQTGNLGWYAYEEGDLDKCIALSKKAVALDHRIATFKYNIALCYLAQGKTDLANEWYVDALSTTAANKLTSQSKEELTGAIKDIDDLLTKKPTLKGATEIRKLLDAELKSL